MTIPEPQSAPAPAAPAAPATQPRRRWRRALAAAGVVAVLAVAGCYLAMRWRVFRAPYPDWGKQVAWWTGNQEQAYNFSVVDEGKLYRSGRLDERWLRYLRDRYGIGRIVTLAGELPGDTAAKQLGMEVVVFRWDPGRLPPRPEMDAALEAMSTGAPTLVHCSAGADRTGYAVASYRVTRQGWPVERAIGEMPRFWHYPDISKSPNVEDGLRQWFGDFAGSQPAVPANPSGP